MPQSVLLLNDPLATRHIVALAREMRPDLHIIVRTRYLSELPELYKLGATQVIPEEFETIEVKKMIVRFLSRRDGTRIAPRFIAGKKRGLRPVPAGTTETPAQQTFSRPCRD